MHVLFSLHVMDLLLIFEPAAKCCCLLQYNDVVLALKRGDLRLLRHALEEHEDRYIRFSYI